MIPKIFFTYWEGDQLSKLHYYTIYSLIKLNPDIPIVIYTSSIESKRLIQWNTSEHSIRINDCINLLDILKISKNIELRKIDFENDYKINNEISCIFKADFIRIAKLYEHGGVWFDFDILFTKSIPNELFENSYDLLYFSYCDTIPTGLLFSTPKNTIMTKLYNEAIDCVFQIDVQIKPDYQVIGPHLWDKHINSFENSKCLSNDLIYSYRDLNIELLFQPNCDITTVDTFGIHWYNGSPYTKNYINQFDENKIDPTRCVIEKYLHHILQIRNIE
jgi:hypothetical protein